MPTLRRTVAILTLPAIAWLGAACERETPTEARSPAGAFQLSSDPTRWVNAVDPTPLNGYAPPGTSCMDPGYQTIQAAVDDAIAGDIIMVCPGTYPEPAGGPLTINKTLMLFGEQNHGVDARGPRGPESMVTDPMGTSVTANNVVIDGLTFQGSTSSNFPYGIAIGAGKSGTHVLNNIIQLNIAGIALSNAPGGAQAVIQQNLIQNNNQLGSASGTGIYTDQFVSGGAVANVLIEENAFKGNDDAGIDVSNTDVANGVSGLDISHNSFDMNGRAVFLLNTHISTIHDNSVTNNTFVGSAAIRLFGGNSSLSIMNNDLVNGLGHAIRLSSNLVGPNSDVAIHENNIGTVGSLSFVGDGLLVDVGSHVGPVNATCNWWGSNTGPTDPINNPSGTGEEVVGDADYKPWLTTPAPGGLCIGGVPSGKVTGGGQVPASGGKATFGFNAKNQAGVGSSGHLNYLNHVTGAHLDCTVTIVTMLTLTTAEFSGTCSPNSAATSFRAHVEDNGTPGKNGDVFRITYPNSMLGVTDGGPLISGNIVIHQ